MEIGLLPALGSGLADLREFFSLRAVAFVPPGKVAVAAAGMR